MRGTLRVTVMDKKDITLTMTLECPLMFRTSQVVENALEDALYSALTYGDDILEGVHLGAYQRNLRDQFNVVDGFIEFDGNEQEVWNYMRDPITGFREYAVELDSMLKTIALHNKAVIDLVQRAHYKAQFAIIRKLPNHWIIEVKGG